VQHAYSCVAGFGAEFPQVDNIIRRALEFSRRAERLPSAIEAIIPDGPMLRPLRRKVAEEYIITVLLQCSS